MKKLCKFIIFAVASALVAATMASCVATFGDNGIVGVWAPDKFEGTMAGQSFSLSVSEISGAYAERFGDVADVEMEFKVDGTLIARNASESTTLKYRIDGNRVILSDASGKTLSAGDIHAGYAEARFEVIDGKLKYHAGAPDISLTVTYKKISKSLFGTGTDGQSNETEAQRKERELQQQQQAEREIIEFLINKLDDLIRFTDGSALLNRVEALRENVVKLPTYRQKLDLVRDEIQAIRREIQRTLDGLKELYAFEGDPEDIDIPTAIDDGFSSDEIKYLLEHKDVLQELIGEYESMADAIAKWAEDAMAALGEPELGPFDQDDGVPGPTPPVEGPPGPGEPPVITDPKTPEDEYPPDGPGNGETVIDGKTPFNDPELWDKAMAEFLARMSDSSLSAEERAAAQQYYYMLLAVGRPAG